MIHKILRIHPEPSDFMRPSENPEDIQMMRISHEIIIFGFRAERSLKSFIIGRKNYLFAKTPAGAGASAICYSIIETAKANGLSPFHYLTYLFEQIPNLPIGGPDAIDKLLPWSNELPQSCRITSGQ
jgi:hypothetical protein